MAELCDGQAVSGACHSVMGAGRCDECGDSAWGEGWGLGHRVASSQWAGLPGWGICSEEKKKEADFPSPANPPATSSPGLSKPGC